MAVVVEPIQRLRENNRNFPNANRLANYFYVGRGNGLPDWPDWCYLPMAAWYQIVCQQIDKERLTTLSDISKVPPLAALGTWNLSQSTYRFNPILFEALISTEITGDLPSEVLLKLPEWCIYINTPGLKYYGKNLCGFWTHLEWDAGSENTELRLLLDHGDEVISCPILIGKWTLVEAIEKMGEEWEKNLQISSVAATIAEQLDLPSFTSDIAVNIAKQINPLLSLILYLCSEEPEIFNKELLSSTPANPQPVKTKKGLKFFPPDKPKIWDVGLHLGESLKRSYSQEQGEGGTVRPHLRRAHWHGYWIGPQSGDRKFIYKWIPPLLINAKNSFQQ